MGSKLDGHWEVSLDLRLLKIKITTARLSKLIAIEAERVVQMVELVIAAVHRVRELRA